MLHIVFHSIISHVVYWRIRWVVVLVGLRSWLITTAFRLAWANWQDCALDGPIYIWWLMSCPRGLARCIIVNSFDPDFRESNHCIFSPVPNCFRIFQNSSLELGIRIRVVVTTMDSWFWYIAWIIVKNVIIRVFLTYLPWKLFESETIKFCFYHVFWCFFILMTEH